MWSSLTHQKRINIIQKHRNQETQTSGFKITRIEKRGLSHDSK